MAMLLLVSSPACTILPVDGSLKSSLVQLMENQPEEFQAHFVAASAQAGILPMQKTRESSSEPFHQQGWGSHVPPKGRQQGG